ncbi:NmrA family NAD(P)-binding protein [Polaribacter sp. Hel_I_88]|uniref:NmrA family NAD(P)-binding protein n=1 Tax=Polaribacter sp. Hel_I_88 TaxID=1250006 RepID=UPI00047E9894|nr:NmrA family NAD(P)-binding protein [Polaribacter sp. Hel_I_88]
MNKILITGATGNIGTEVVNFLNTLTNKAEIIVAVRNIASAKNNFRNQPNLGYRTFNFKDPQTYTSAFKDIEILFLLRPPQIAEVNRYFKPLLESAKKNGIEKIVFLSVQGAEKSNIIPHNKIERLIKLIGFQYIFVRPSYFMQNLTTTLLAEILEDKTITLPAKQAKFNWIDVKNIAEVIAILLQSFHKYENNIFEITGSENKNFDEVTKIMTTVTGTKFQFKSINPIRFYFKKRKSGMESSFAFVITLLHFLPRLEKEPEITNNYFKITGKTTTTLKEFIKREKSTLLGH